MSDEYDVFAELYDNSTDDKAKFLEALNSHNTAIVNDGSSDDDIFLSNLPKNGRGRGKKAGKSVPNKGDPLEKKVSASKKADNLQTKIPEVQPQQPAPEISGPVTRRRSTRSSTARSSQPPTETATVSNTSVRGRKGRRSTKKTVSNATETTEVNNTTQTINMPMNGASRRSVMRARRTYFAEIAARSTNVDYVDLVSSPMPRIEGVISVDSEGEESSCRHSVEIPSATTVPGTLECSFDEDNPEISVKVKWNGGTPEVFQLRKHQKFQNIFSEIAEREKMPLENLVFNIDNRIISPIDTPASINYKIYDFISGRVLINLLEGGAVRKKRDVNIITLKIQSDLWPKRPLKVELNKTDKFKILYIKCAEELNMSTEKLTLSFDGDYLDLNGTPEDHELEGGEAIDLRVKKI